MHNNDTIINTDVADQRRHPLHRPQEVSIVDIRMPFWSMVVFMVKLSLAAIPAFIILAVIYVAAIAVFGGIIAGIMHH
jgi:hypothetical protein